MHGRRGQVCECVCVGEGGAAHRRSGAVGDSRSGRQQSARVQVKPEPLCGQHTHHLQHGGERPGNQQMTGELPRPVTTLKYSVHT